MNIKDFQKLVHQNSKNKGFWHNKGLESIPEKLALIHAEVSEVLEAYRELEPGSNNYVYDENGKPEGIGVELIDILIRTFDLAEYLGLDTETILTAKHNYNLTRPFMHKRRC